jgi:ribosomal protein S18 acetylase RimI-like enzyme
VLIRRAAPGDYERAGALTEAAYEEFIDDPEDYYREHLRDAEGRDRDAELWVAVDDDGEPVGTVTYCPVGSVWRELSGPDEGEFRMLAVAPSQRGRGTGEALARHCEVRARADGFVQMVLSSLDEMTAAHRIYERLGYRRDPSRDWIPQPDIPLWCFVKDL